MKRKLFSAILFGALLTASTSGLTSCKDYDDDISNLQSQIDKLATVEQLQSKASELQAAISAAQSAAESKAAAAETVAKAAQSAADAAATAASKAQSTADGASQAAKDAAAAAAAANEVGKAAQAAVDKLAAEAATKAELEAAAAAAKTYVDSVKDAIEAAHAADKATIEKAIADGLDEVKAEIAKTNEALAALDARVKAAEDKLAAIEAGEGQEELIKAIAEELEAIDNGLEYLGISVSEMITAIHLYAGLDGFTNALNFYQVKEAVDRTFPYGDEVENVTDETVEFKSGTVRALEDSILVRVSPASAVLHAEDLSLINTQGQELDADLFESIEVKEFNREAPMTRAEGNNNTGLWVVKFKLVKDFDADKFAAATVYNKKQVVFALAVANCDVNLSEDRRVATEFDVTAAAPLATHATTFYLQPESADAETNVADVHHRFDAFTNPLAGTFPASLKGDDWTWKNYLNGNNDLAAGKANLVFDKEATGNAQNAEKEARRQDMKVLAVNEGEKIAIRFDKPIKAFYVTVDWKRAGESGNSEINAWNTYSYTNVGKVDKDGKVIEAAPVQYGDKGFISVDELKQYASQGDVIGFRVWAVNLDGSMVDPDGTAFYVGIGQNADVNVKEVSGSALVTAKTPSAKQNIVMIDVADAFGVDFDAATFSQETYNMDGNSGDQKGKGYKPSVTASLFATPATEDIVIKAYKADGKTATTATSEVKKLAVQIVNPQNLVDGKTYTIKATLTGTVGATTAIVRYVNIKVTKEMPTGIPAEYTVNRSDLQDAEQLMVSTPAAGGTAWKIAGTTTNGTFDAKYQWNANPTAPLNLAPTYRTGSDYNWQIALLGGSAMGYGKVDLAQAYYLPSHPNGVNINWQTELSFEVSGARVALTTELGSDGKIKPAQPLKKAYNYGDDVNDAAAPYALNRIAGQFADGTEHSVKAWYTYAGIGHSFSVKSKGTPAKWDRVATSATVMPAGGENVEFSQACEPIKFMTWSTQSEKFVRYAWGKYCLAAGDATHQNTYTDANQIDFNATTQLKTENIQITFGPKVLNQDADFKNTWANGNLGKMLTNGFLKIVDIKVLYGAAASPVIDIDRTHDIVTNGTIKFNQLSATTTEHEETLVIEVIDCYSQHSVIKLPIKVVATPVTSGVAGNTAGVNAGKIWNSGNTMAR